MGFRIWRKQQALEEPRQGNEPQGTVSHWGPHLHRGVPGPSTPESSAPCPAQVGALLATSRQSSGTELPV